MNVGRCYTSPAEYLGNCAIPALGWKWSSDFEAIESAEGTLLWSGELREVLQQTQRIGLPNLRITMVLAAALLRREAFNKIIADGRETRAGSVGSAGSVFAGAAGKRDARAASGLANITLDPLAVLAREIKSHPLIQRLQQAHPLPHQVGEFVQRIFQNLEVDGFFGGDGRHVLALLDSQVNYRLLRKRLASSPLADPPLGTGFADIHRILHRLGEIDADETLDLWKTGHSYLAAYNDSLTTLGPTTLGQWVLGYTQEQSPESSPASGPALTPDEALKELARLEGGEVVKRTARGMYPALHFPSLRPLAAESLQGGYSDITRSGSIDRVLISQLAYDTDEFLRRFAENELLYFQNQKTPEIPIQPLVCLLDMGVQMWGRPRLMAAGCALAAWKMAWVKRRPFELYQTFFGEATRTAQDQPQGLAAILAGIDDSESPAEALKALWNAQHKQTQACDFLLITSSEALKAPALRQALEQIRPDWRAFTITLDRKEEMQFCQISSGTPRLLARVDLLSFTPAAKDAGAAIKPVAAEANRMLPNLFRIGHREAVTALTFTPDSSLLFSGDGAGRICWWGPRRKTLDQETVLPRSGMEIRDMTAGATMLAVLALETNGTTKTWRLLRFNLINGALIDDFALPVPGEEWVRWPKIAPDQKLITMAQPGKLLLVYYGDQAQPNIGTISIPGTPIAYVQGRRWDMQYVLTEQRNLYRVEIADQGGVCRHLRPEPGSHIAVDREGSILALRGRDLVLYPANANKDSGPSDESIVAALKNSNWQEMLGAWDGSVLLSSPQHTLFIPADARNKPLQIPQAASAPWALSPWGPLMAVGLQREIRVFHSRLGEPLFFTPTPRLQSSVMNMFFGQDGNELWVNYGAAVGHHWQWSGPLAFRQTSGHSPPPRSVNYSLVNSAVHRIEFYAGKTLIAMERHRIAIAGSHRSWNSCDELVSCAVHPGDSQLAVIDSRNVIWILRTDDLSLIAALYGSEERFAAWSAAGHALGDVAILGSSKVGADYQGFSAYIRGGAQSPRSVLR